MSANRYDPSGPGSAGRWIWYWIQGILVLLLAGGCVRAAERKSVLFLHLAGPERESLAQFFTRYQDELARLWPARVSLRIEEIEAAMPSDPKLLDWLKRKYDGAPPDLIAALEGPGSSLSILIRHALRPEAPVVMVTESGMGTGRRHYFSSQPNVTQVLLDQDVTGLLESARRLCPDAKHLFFTPNGRKPTEEMRVAYRRDAEQFAAAHEMEFTDLADASSFSALLERVGAMPPHSILLRRDPIVGGIRRPADRAKAMQQFSATANGPLFTLADAWAEDGAVGTGTVDYARLGEEMAAQTVAVFKAGSATAVPSVRSQAFTLSFDWRQLQRWGLDEKRLPPGSDIRFRRPGLWETYRGTMIGITAALAVQTGLIIALLLQRRWRKRAETALHQQREQLSHTLRLATLSQMASSLAHELNQPLTAIVNNAGTARRMIARGKGDAGELSEILRDITDDGHRAGEVIRGIRGMVRQGESTLQVVTVAELIAAVRRMTDAEARARGCVITEELPPGLPCLEVNAVQLQQVLLNLLVNALDAMNAPGTATRRIIIRAEAEGETTVCVSVRDFGPGLPPDGLEKVFEQYYTTKPNGMGMGLVIVRSIVEAHGGTLGAANAEGGGARFYFRLPAVRPAAT